MAYRVAKRAIDIFFSALGLLLLWPAFLMIAALVRFSDPGPIFFVHERVGQRGKNFQLLKFRSMRVSGAGASSVTAADDPRITRTGAFLRRWKLDELPQLFNVLVGHMSLVGPRPEVPMFIAEYSDDLRDKILSVRPGLTDFATVKFVDEERLLANAANPNDEYIRTILPVKQQYYSEYVDRQCLRVDLEILFLTLLAIFRRR